jgi:hypothetical protein
MLKLILRYLGCGGVVLFVASIALAQTSPPPPRDDFQLWNDLWLITPLNKKADLIVSGTIRFGGNVSQLIDERIGVSFNIRANKFLTLTPTWLYLAQQPVARPAVYENRLNFAATVSVPLGKFVLSDRHQFERRLLHSRNDTTRYRNRVQLERPLTWGGVKFQPYASYEIFYDWGAHAWTRHRFITGASKPLSKHLTADIYYLHQQDGFVSRGNWRTLGMLLKIRL